MYRGEQLNQLDICWAQNVVVFLFFFFNDTATTEIYTLSLHDALPISGAAITFEFGRLHSHVLILRRPRSEEHTSELQSRVDLVCRLLLEKKKKNTSHFLHIQKKKKNKTQNKQKILK